MKDECDSEESFDSDQDEGLGWVARSLQMRGGRMAHQRIQYKPMMVQRGRKRKMISWAIAPKRLTAKR